MNSKLECQAVKNPPRTGLRLQGKRNDYLKATVEILNFDNVDVITGSPNDDGENDFFGEGFLK